MSKTRPPSDMLARFRKTAEQPKPVAVVVPEEATLPQPTRSKGRTVRITLDLASAQHKFLKRLALEEELTLSDLLRAVVRLMEEDAGLVQRAVKQARSDPGD